MTKIEMIKEYGNDLVATDVTDYYKPLVLCYWDDEKVLAYDVNKDTYHYVRVQTYASEYGNYFMIDGKRYKFEDFVRSGGAWGRPVQTIEDWKKDMNDVVGD